MQRGREGHGQISGAQGEIRTIPLLYDLTSLQRDANRILGFTAQQTLDYTQALYEKKLVKYPRTDSRYLTEDMKPMLPDLLTHVVEKIGAADAVPTSDYDTEAAASNICNSKKFNDHHAIIPNLFSHNKRYCGA